MKNVLVPFLVLFNYSARAADLSMVALLPEQGSSRTISSDLVREDQNLIDFGYQNIENIEAFRS